MNRHKATPLIVVLVVAIAAAAGWYVWSQRSGNGQTSGVVISGAVDAEQVQVSSLVSGRITSASIAEGDRVAAGTVVYRIDDRALKLQVEQAQAAVRAAKAAYDQAVDDKASSADKAAAKAQWQQAQAAEQIARVQLGYATISAPASGTVTAVALTTGELATPGKTLATITRTGSLFVRAFVPETQIGDVRVGGKATIVTDSGKTVDATVTFVATDAQFTPSNVETKDQRAKLVYEVRLVPVAPEALTPGLPVTVTVAQ